MISERQCITDFRGAWNRLTPMIGETVRKLNHSAKRIGLWSNLEKTNDPLKPSLISELAFRLYAYDYKVVHKDNKKVKKIYADSRIYIASLANVKSRQIASFNSKDWNMVNFQLRNIHRFKDAIFPKIAPAIHPEFQGAGILDSCEGDLLFNDNLIEIKAAHGGIKRDDLRQVLLYCAIG